MGNVFKIETLSPVHIGSGNTITPLDIGEHDSFIYVFDIDKVSEAIPINNLDKIIELISGFTRENKNINNFGDIIKDEIRPEDWDRISLYKAKKKDIGSIHGIDEEIKYGNQVYIPGSTIKGAIRTAIIYSFLKRKGYSFGIEVTSIKGKKSIKYLQMKKPNGEVVDGIRNNKIDFSTIENEIKKDMLIANATKDVFKCLRVSDSSAIPAERSLEVRKVYVANTTSFVKQRGTRRISMHPSFVECIKPDIAFTNIQIDVDEKTIEALSKIYAKEKEIFMYIIGLIKDWRLCLEEFSEDLIEAEIKFWETERKGIVNNIKTTYGSSPHKYIANEDFKINDVIEHLKAIKQENAILIRLGKYSGYLAHSMGILLAQGISNTSYNLIEFGKLLSKYNHSELFPLTRRLTLDNQTLGWCKLVESNGNEKKESEDGEQSKQEAKKDLKNNDIREALKSKGWRVR